MRAAHILRRISHTSKPYALPPAKRILEELRTGKDYFVGPAVDDKMAEINEPGSRSTLAEMSPADFLDMARSGFDPAKAATVERVLKREGSFRTLPHLRIDKNGKVKGHEGRHRARALAMRGVKTIPVEIRSETYRWSSDRPENAPKELEAQGNTKRISMPQHTWSHRQ